MSQDINDIHWTATDRAHDEAVIASAGLSIRQRKLLALMNTPVTAAKLAEAAKLPAAEIESSLKRFKSLGLAVNDEVVPPAPLQARPSTFAPMNATTTTVTVNTTSTIAPKVVTVDHSMRASAPMPEKSKLPLIAGGVAVGVLALAGWFLSRPSTPAPGASAPAAGATVATPVPAAPAPAEPAPVASVTAPIPAPAPAVPTNPLTPREIAAEKAATEKTARDAAKVAADAAKAAAAQKANPTAAATPAPTPVAAPAAAPVATPAPVPVAPAPTSAPVAAAPTPTPTPAIAAPTPAPVAAAPPAAARPAPAAPREAKLLERVEPAFPRGAEVDSGTIRARLTVNGNGAVTGVEITEATPPRVFDRAVRAALLQWKYEAIGETSTKLVEISFKR
jgi:TonB family protein